MILQLITIAICAGCKLIGELFWHNAQRYIMPIVLGAGCSYVSHTWWLGFTMLPMIAGLVMGYKTYGKSDGFDRGMWLFLICVLAGLGPVITHHLSLWFYIPYCIVGGIWGATTRGLLNLVIAPLSGILIGSIIFFVH